MKQKLVIKMQMDCQKCRNKALKTAAEVAGVTSVSLEGDATDSIAVIGNDVDTICLANSLRKKFRTVTIVSVEKVKSAAEKKAEEDKKKEEEKKKKDEELKKCRELLGPKCPCSCCHGKCDDTLKCHGPKCDGQCTCNPSRTKCDVKCTCNTTCTKCENTKCDGHCFSICIKCENSKCLGKCKPKPCSKCQDSKCTGECKPKPPSPCYRTCPPWCTCPKCYVPYPNPIYSHYPPNCTIVYDQPDSCSIM